MVVDNFEHREIVPQADFVVVYVVGGGYLEAACSEVHLHVVVFDDGDFLVNKWNEDFLPA